MKAQALHNRPAFGLIKKDDSLSCIHYRLPKWLLEDERYMDICMDAVFVYTLLYNRLMLSKARGWHNEDGEVFIVYTRLELSRKLRIGEKRVTAAMRELCRHNLIWERRCGRGFANQIYLAEISHIVQPAEPSVACCQSEETDKTADTAVFDLTREPQASGDGPPDPEPSNWRVLKSENDGSATADTTGLEPSNRPSSNIDITKTDFSTGQSGHSGGDGWSDTARIDAILDNAELHCLPEDEAQVVRCAIERLYYSAQLRTGGAVYPQSHVRRCLARIDFDTVQAALRKLRGNTENRVRNSGAYVTVVLFNTIMEALSDMLVDPFLNGLRAASGGPPP